VFEVKRQLEITSCLLCVWPTGGEAQLSMPPEYAEFRHTSLTDKAARFRCCRCSFCGNQASF